MKTLLLDRQQWDLVLDAHGNIAVASGTYPLAQDAASYCLTFKGECYFDVNLGIPYLESILGQSPSIMYAEKLLNDEAKTVPGVKDSRVIITDYTNGKLSAQIQVLDANSNLAQLGIQ